MTLFTNTPIEVGGKRLAVGAYTMFLIPTAKRWTLIISRDLDISGTYYETMDLVRVPYGVGRASRAAVAIHD